MSFKMEDLYLSWDVILQKESEGKLFYNIKSNKFNKKYFLFCYYGYHSYMTSPNYKGETYKDVVIYLKKAGKKKKEFIEIDCISFRIPLNSFLQAHLLTTYRKIVNAKIYAEERKEKISKILNK
jgi:hypothetical protein